jgi:hypothetical protein
MLTASQARLIAPLSENHYNLYKYVLPAITQRAYDGWSWCEIDFTNIPHTDMASLLSSLEHNEYHGTPESHRGLAEGASPRCISYPLHLLGRNSSEPNTIHVSFH